MDLEKVTLRHPNPEVADAQVPASAVDHYRAHGWLTEAEYDERQEAEQRRMQVQQQTAAPRRRSAKEDS